MKQKQAYLEYIPNGEKDREEKREKEREERRARQTATER